MIDDAIRAAVTAAVADAIAAAEARIIAEIRQGRPVRRGTVADAATEKHVSQCTVRRWIVDGTLTAHKVGGRILVDLDSGEPKSNDEIDELAMEAQQSLATGER